jgi:hypothetical protein
VRKVRATRKVLVTNDPHATPAAEELLVWVGPSAPPVRFGAPVVRTRTEAEAVEFVACAPACVRVALDDPLTFLAELAEAGTAPARRVA